MRLIAFLRGIREFRNSVTSNYGIDTYNILDKWYDRGRDFGHLLTRRYYDV